MHITKEQAEAFAKKLEDLINDLDETGYELVRRSYVGAFRKAHVSIVRRILSNEFAPLSDMQARWSQDRIYD